MNKALIRRIIRRSYKLIHKPRNSSGHKHFTFIVKRNKILAVGWNTSKTNPMAHFFGHRYCATHSELCAIKYFIRSFSHLDKFIVVNVRISGGGAISMSRPCPACQKLLQYYGVDECWYTDVEGEFVNEHLLCMSG